MTWQRYIGKNELGKVHLLICPDNVKKEFMREAKEFNNSIDLGKAR